ncbi:MAG: MmcQ/YjbR family DNA-binding protein [Clostridiales bacterium]|nr:MmcQ/YjbR family DNA-binding protein [Clostridiales bacterium]
MKYGDEPEYLWNDLPDAAVIRRKDTQKWYVLLMTVLPKRLGLSGDEPIEIVDLRFNPDELPSKIDGERYFAGYHMNKKHWITILLDGSVPLAEILDYVDKSYLLAKK